jgi:hypothetical protein
MATSFEVETMTGGYHEYKNIEEAEISDKLQCQWQMGNPYNVYMPVMQPTSLLAMVLITLKVHWDRVNYCCCRSQSSSIRT